MAEYFPLRQRTPILRGWSGEEKFRAITAKGDTVLYRCSSADSFAKKEKEFRYMCTAAALGISMPQPIAIGQNEEGVYTLTEFIEGDDLESILPTLSQAEAYRLGEEAGRILRTLHTIPAPADILPWDVRFNQKIDRKIQGYKNCGIRFPGDDAILRYIEDNRALLKNRPQCMQHGDYHIGNLMLRRSQVVVIDFNRFDWGDPWEEFNRIVWCAQASAPFAKGRIQGYFAGDPPMEFWKLLALYISSNTLSSIYWAIPFGEAEIQTMLQQAADVQTWYDTMTNVIPRWYR